VKNQSDTQLWRCPACFEVRKNQSRLRRCPACKQVVTLEVVFAGN
jgi:rubrerythrin